MINQPLLLCLLSSYNGQQESSLVFITAVHFLHLSINNTDIYFDYIPIFLQKQQNILNSILIDFITILMLITYNEYLL